MCGRVLRFAAIVFLLFPVALAQGAEPIKLKFAFFSSDRTTINDAIIRPFVDAVNAGADGLVEIEVSYSGKLGSNPVQQLQLVLDGVADLAFVVPGYTPERFPDTTLIELPGLFRDMREATLVYSRLASAGALAGYQDVVVLGAVATAPETVHTRPPVDSLDALRGKRIRVNNPMQARALTRLGGMPVHIPINKTATAISSGEIDGATAPAYPLVEFGIARVTPCHYLLGIGAVPLAVLMNRDKFNSLPKQAQEVLLRQGGEALARRYIAIASARDDKLIGALKEEAGRKFVYPSQADRQRAEAEFEAVIREWRAASPSHSGLLAKARAEIAAIRQAW